MTSPALAIPVRKRGRAYPFPPVDLSHLPRKWDTIDPADVPENVKLLPSVTTVLQVLDKPALRGWYAEQALLSAHDEWYGFAFDCEADEFVKAHKYAANKRRDQRAEAGTRAHTLAERLTIDAPLPSHISEEDEAYADAFMAFWTDHDPEPTWVEQTVADAVIGYAGTADLFCKMKNADGEVERHVVDWKTRAGAPDDDKIAKYGLLYDENILQLAALASAVHRYVPTDDGWTMEFLTIVPQAMGVVLFEDGQYRTQRVGPAQLANAFECFTALVKVWNWKKGLA